MTAGRFTGKSVSHVWRRWAASRLIDREPLDAVIGKLVDHGFDRDASRAACAELENHPAVDAGRRIADRLAKVYSILDIRQELRELSTARREIMRARGVSTMQFLDEYYSANLPVVLLDVAQRWPAVTKWSASYLLELFGNEPIEVMARREMDDRFDLNWTLHRFTMPFSRFAQHVLSSSSSNDQYLVANNRLLETSAAEPLWHDFAIDNRYLDEQQTAGKVFLWFGPAGTITQLHHDVGNVLFVQIHGRKRIRLIDPLETHCVYNDVLAFSEVDAARPDLETYPKFARTRNYTIVLEPGQALFLPVGWWHHVTALETSISLSFTNFRWNNKFEWRHPNDRPQSITIK